MSSNRDAPHRRSAVARFTPDSRRWRRRVAGAAAIGAPLALYAAVAVISGVKSGMVYNLLILVFAVLALVLPAVAATALLAPNSGRSRPDASRDETPIEALKRRYATGEIDRAEFDRRLDDLVAGADDARGRATDGSAGGRAERDPELDATER